MSTDSRVLALDPVGPWVLFDEARGVAYDTGPGWTLDDRIGGIPAYRSAGTPDAAAIVLVEFCSGGGLSTWEEAAPGEYVPAGYALARFRTLDFTSDDAILWAHHAGLVRQLGRRLDARGVRWAWSFGTDPWIRGTVPQSRPGRGQ